MFKNYLTVAIRNILKYKFFSAINIMGMTIGIAACLFIVIYIADELSFDRFHENADRIYQVGLHGKIAGQDIMTATTCPPMAAALVDEVPGVEEATRIIPYYNQAVVRYGDKMFTEEKVVYADSNFFRFFSFGMTEGDPATALKEPNSVVITEAIATKYFGKESPIDKLIALGNDKKSLKVTGVTPVCPTNSHLKYDFLISSSTDENLRRGGIWLNNFMYTYFRKNEEASLAAIEKKFDDLVVKYVGPEMEKFIGTSIEKMKKDGGAFGYYTTPLTDIHLRSVSRNDFEPGGNITYIYFFGGIGIFIVVIACINFMNLSTARSAGRAKEVGLRKTLGSLRTQMIWQFLAESLIYSTLTVVLAVLLCSITLPYFNILSGKELAVGALFSVSAIIGLIALVVVVGLLAGSYPAFYLTSFNAVEVLKGKVRAGMKSKGVRSVLVIAQFSLSIFLIIFTAVVYKQIRFMQDRDLGMDKENVLIVQNTDRMGTNDAALKNELDALNFVSSTSYTNNTFPGVNNTTVFKAPASEQDHIMGLYFADYDHLNLMKFQLASGRYFSKDFPSDTTAILINEAAVKEFGFTDPLKEELLFNDSKPERLRIIGVIKDFNFESLKTSVRPISIRLTKKANQLMVRYEGNPKEAVANVERVWKKLAPNEPFDYKFMDDEYDKLFRVEQRMGDVFTVFSGLAIFIASLGLFALAAFTSEQRTKEIGIRKAMGATTVNLTLLLSKEFTRLVIIAFVPAGVAGWYVANHWLNDFAYRVDVDPFILVWSGLGAVIIAWATVSYQAIKTAIANPVKSLRYE